MPGFEGEEPRNDFTEHARIGRSGRRDHDVTVIYNSKSGSMYSPYHSFVLCKI